MTPSLRKKHRLIWQFLSLVIAAAFIATMLIRPQEFFQKQLPKNTPEAYSTLIKSQQTDDFVANLKQSADGKKQIEIILKDILKTPTATLLLSNAANQPIESATALGRLGNSGIYRFNLNSVWSQSDQYHLTIYDHIKQKEILSTQL